MHATYVVQEKNFQVASDNWQKEYFYYKYVHERISMKSNTFF